MGFALLPTGGSEKVGIPLGWTSAGGPTSDRPHRWQRRSDLMPPLYSYTSMTSNCAPPPRETQWTPGPSTAKSLCASTVAFRPGSHVSVSDSSPSVIVSTWKDLSTTPNNSEIRLNLDNPIDLTEHLLSPFAMRDFHYQGCHFHSAAHLMCFRYAVINDLKLLATSVRKWSRHLTDFPADRFNTHDWQVQCRSMLKDIYSHLCLTDVAVSRALVDTGPRPFVLKCHTQQGGVVTS